MDPDTLPLDDEEARVLACLVEKAATTPDHYPMTLNGLRVACNQTSNRDPVVEYDEPTVERALRRLADRSLAKMVHRPGDRVVKYRHALDETWGADGRVLALLAVLVLRGPQTPGELRQRTLRYVDFGSPATVEAALEELIAADPPLVERLPRRPGRREVRYRHRLGRAVADGDEAAPQSGSSGRSDGSGDEISDRSDDGLADEVARLGAELTELRARFDRLATELGVDEPG